MKKGAGLLALFAVPIDERWVASAEKRLARVALASGYLEGRCSRPGPQPNAETLFYEFHKDIGAMLRVGCEWGKACDAAYDAGFARGLKVKKGGQHAGK